MQLIFRSNLSFLRSISDQNTSSPEQNLHISNGSNFYHYKRVDVIKICVKNSPVSACCRAFFPASLYLPTQTPENRCLRREACKEAESRSWKLLHRQEDASLHLGWVRTSWFPLPQSIAKRSMKECFQKPFSRSVEIWGNWAESWLYRCESGRQVCVLWRPFNQDLIDVVVIDRSLLRWKLEGFLGPTSLLYSCREKAALAADFRTWFLHDLFPNQTHHVVDSQMTPDCRELLVCVCPCVRAREKLFVFFSFLWPGCNHECNGWQKSQTNGLSFRINILNLQQQQQQQQFLISSSEAHAFPANLSFLLDFSTCFINSTCTEYSLWPWTTVLVETRLQVRPFLNDVLV